MTCEIPDDVSLVQRAEFAALPALMVEALNTALNRCSEQIRSLGLFSAEASVRGMEYLTPSGAALKIELLSVKLSQ